MLDLGSFRIKLTWIILSVYYDISKAFQEDLKEFNFTLTPRCLDNRSTYKYINK